MRREYLFGLCHLAGLAPAEQDELILGDYAALIDDIDEHVKILNKGA